MDGIPSGAIVAQWIWMVSHLGLLWLSGYGWYLIWGYCGSVDMDGIPSGTIVAQWMPILSNF